MKLLSLFPGLRDLPYNSALDRINLTNKTYNAILVLEREGHINGKNSYRDDRRNKKTIKG
jgi:hypothetical protein